MRRPPGLRLRPAAGPWWRIDSARPNDWDWTPFPTPRHRFDPLSGRFRVRYAASRAVVAARERFPGRALTESDGDLWIVRLDDMPASLHLTHQANLDALGVDDRINTGRLDVDRSKDPDPLLDTCGRLMDVLYDGWTGQPPPIVYRARTTPSGRNVVFTERTQPKVDQIVPLRHATALLVYLVMQAGFIVPDDWLA